MVAARRSKAFAPASQKNSIQQFGKISKAQQSPKSGKSQLQRKLDSKQVNYKSKPIDNPKKRKADDVEYREVVKHSQPATPRKKARLPPRIAETPTKGARSLLESFQLAPSKLPKPAPVIKQVETPPSSQEPETASEIPNELQNLIDLHSCFLTALSLHYAHNGQNTPADLRILCPNISRTWQKRRVSIEDIRTLLTILQRPDSKPIFTLSDYGHGKICLELSDLTQKKATRRPVNEEALNDLFQENLRTLWASSQHSSPASESPKDFITTLPLYPISTNPSLAKLTPLLSKGQTRLTDLKARAIQAQARALKVTTGNTTTTTTTTTKQTPNDDDGQAAKPTLQDRSAALKSRIFARQQQVSTLSGTPLSPEQLARRRALQRVVEVAPVLESLASSFSQRRRGNDNDEEEEAAMDAFGDVTVAARHHSFTMPTLVQNLQMSLRNPISGEEACEAVRCLGELTPEWVGVRCVGRVVGVTVRGGGVGRRVLEGRVRGALERL